MTETKSSSKLIKDGLSAVLAGAQLAEKSQSRVSVSQKGNLRDIVTQADLDISNTITQKLTANGWKVISEEEKITDKIPKEYWLIDPIDGSVNYSHELPEYTISAGWVENSECQLGVVCAPAMDELYFTLKPDRALLNGKPFKHVHRCMDEALVAASFAAKGSHMQYKLFQIVNERTRGCLRTGSASLNLCWAAKGKLQAAYGFNARLWDIAGGLAVAKAAGCKVYVQKKDNFTTDYIVGSREVASKLVEYAKNEGLWG